MTCSRCLPFLSIHILTRTVKCSMALVTLLLWNGAFTLAAFKSSRLWKHDHGVHLLRTPTDESQEGSNFKSGLLFALHGCLVLRLMHLVPKWSATCAGHVWQRVTLLCLADNTPLVARSPHWLLGEAFSKSGIECPDTCHYSQLLVIHHRLQRIMVQSDRWRSWPPTLSLSFREGLFDTLRLAFLKPRK